MHQQNNFGIKATYTGFGIDPMITAKNKSINDYTSTSHTRNHSEQLSTEYEINDVPLSARNILTKGHTHDEITTFSGCVITTRGRYMSTPEKSKNPSERPLYLYIQGPNKQSLDLAIQKIDEIIRMEPLSQHKYRSGASGISASSIMSAEKVYVGIENVTPNFDLRGKLIGARGANLNYIRSETGAIVTLRGKGSLFIETALGTESSEPLHLYIEHPKFEGLTAAKKLALNLIETLQQEVIQCQPQVIIQPQGQQLAMYPQVQPIPPPMAMIPPHLSGLNFKMGIPPPTQIVPTQLNVPPPGINVPGQQGSFVTHPPVQTHPPQLNAVTPNSQNLTGNSNMVMTSTGSIMTSQPNISQANTPIYVSQANQNPLSNISGQNQIQYSQASQLNVRHNTPINVSSQQQQIQPESQVQIAPNQQLQDTTTLIGSSGSQFQVPPPSSQQNMTQIIGFNPNFPQQFVPTVQNGAQIPQMQILPTGQPLHILSSQGLTVQNPQFVHQQVAVNQLQAQPNTIQQIVPANASGQVTFQIPIQGQQSGPFVQQSNIQSLSNGQTQILLAQQQLQSAQGLQTITNVQSPQFFQQQNFQNQIPIVQGVPTTQGQYITQGQMGVYTSQGLVLVQNSQGNQNVQIPGLNSHVVTSMTSQQEMIQTVQQQPLSLNTPQPATTMQVQVNLPPPLPQGQNTNEQQKQLEREQMHGQTGVIQEISSNPQPVQTSSQNVSVLQNVGNLSPNSALLLQQSDDSQFTQSTQVQQNITNSQENLIQHTQQQVFVQGQLTTNFQTEQNFQTVQNVANCHIQQHQKIMQPFQIPQSLNQNVPQFIQEQKNSQNVTQYVVMHQVQSETQSLPQGAVVGNITQTQNQVIQNSQLSLPQNNLQNTQFNFPPQQNLQNTHLNPSQSSASQTQVNFSDQFASHSPTFMQTAQVITSTPCPISNSNRQSQGRTTQALTDQNQQLQNYGKTVENPDEQPQNKKRRCSDANENSSPGNQNVKKAGVGIEQMQNNLSTLGALNQQEISLPQSLSVGTLQADNKKTAKNENKQFGSLNQSWTKSSQGNQPDSGSWTNANSYQTETVNQHGQRAGQEQTALMKSVEVLPVEQSHNDPGGLDQLHQQQQQNKVIVNDNFIGKPNHMHWKSGLTRQAAPAGNQIIFDAGSERYKPHVNFRQGYPNPRHQYDHRRERQVFNQYQANIPFYMQNTGMPPRPPPSQQFPSNWYPPQGGWM